MEYLALSLAAADIATVKRHYKGIHEVEGRYGTNPCGQILSIRSPHKTDRQIYTRVTGTVIHIRAFSANSLHYSCHRTGFLVRS
jgi:hypothetical protein